MSYRQLPRRRSARRRGALTSHAREAEDGMPETVALVRTFVDTVLAAPGTPTGTGCGSSRRR
ncbi:hypothetical protein AB0A81_39415 [Streptomyces flaveolus]|uniref:Uncharacterized protein n=1 Tax=Streptomyces flaveolus TaxID=67297 RepID=A0ABV1VBW3_9ACTN